MGPYTRYIYSATKSYGSSPNFVHVDNLDNGGFASLYAVDQQTAEAIQSEGTTAQFKGVVGDPQDTLWIDADSSDQAGRIEEKLKTLGLSYAVYTTGNRGKHFAIHRPGSPSHLLPQRDRQWVENTFGAGDPDLSIYTHLHLFRLPGTLHEATGQPKSILSEFQGLPLQLPKMRRQELPIRLSEFTRNPGSSIFASLRVMANTVPTSNGDRHPTLVRLAYALRDATQVGADAALWWMLETNKLFPEPRHEEDVEKIHKSIFGGL